MKSTVYLSDFRDAFARAGRKDQFSYEALELLFDYFEEIDPDYDLDVIAICCEYSEEQPEDIAADYSIDVDDPEDCFDQVLEYLENHTSVVGYTKTGSIIYAQF